MPIQGSYVSCGVQQFYSLGPLQRFYTKDGQPTLCPCPYLDKMLHEFTLWKGHVATIVFSDSDVNGNGVRTAKEIRAQFPESVLMETSAVNPNSGNYIRTWLWTPNWADVAAYCEKYGLGSVEAMVRFRNVWDYQRRYEPKTPAGMTRWE